MRKILILACLFCLLYARFAEWLFDNGTLLCRLHNLPHRGLGMIYASTVLRPDRPDYARLYLAWWHCSFNEKEQIAEGTTRPVVPMLAVNWSKRFHRDRDLQTVCRFIVEDQMNKKQQPISFP